MFSMTVNTKRWLIYVNGVQQAGGTAMVYFPNKTRYSFELGFGAAEQLAHDLGSVNRVRKIGIKNRRLGQLARRITKIAYSYKKLEA